MVNIEDILTKEIHERARAIGFPVSEINSKTDFLKSGLYDSMSFIDLLVSIEEKCGVEIDLEQISPDMISTTGKLKDLVLKLKT